MMTSTSIIVSMIYGIIMSMSYTIDKSIFMPTVLLSILFSAFAALSQNAALLILSISITFLIATCYLIAIRSMITIWNLKGYLSNKMNELNDPEYRQNINKIVQSSIFLCFAPFIIIAANSLVKYSIEQAYFSYAWIFDILLMFDPFLNPRMLFVLILALALFLAITMINKIKNLQTKIILSCMIISVSPIIRLSITSYRQKIEAIAESETSTNTMDIIKQLINPLNLFNAIFEIAYGLCPSNESGRYDSMICMEFLVQDAIDRILTFMNITTVNATETEKALQSASIKAYQDKVYGDLIKANKNPKDDAHYIFITQLANSVKTLKDFKKKYTQYNKHYPSYLLQSEKIYNTGPSA